MVEVVRSVFSSRTAPFVLSTALCLGGCAEPARPLPQDVTSVGASSRLTAGSFSEADRSLSCTDIGEENERVSSSLADLHGAIEKDRSRNQTVTYLGGVFFPPLLFAVELGTKEKAAINELGDRRDVLMRLSAFKNC